MKSRIITIAGALGGGKSSTAKRVAADLGYAHFSSGDLFRAIAKERGLTIEQINTQAEMEHEIDHAVDKRLQDMASESDFVIDSRMAYHWMPNSFKVYLDLDPRVAAERIYKQIQTEGRAMQSGDTVEAIYENTLARRASEQKRYMNLYSVDALDTSPFDLVIDTAKNDLHAVVSIVTEKYKSWLES